MSTKPFEVVAQPYTLYLAPVGTTFPDIDATPSAPWVKVGTSGDLNYDQAGVKVIHKQKIELWRALGSAGPRKAFRTEEELNITLTLVDLTLEEYANALNFQSVSTTPAGVGAAGYKSFELSRGLEMPLHALLVRGAGASPYGDGWAVQYQVPVVVSTGDPDVIFVKGKPAGLALEFQALEDPDASPVTERFGTLVAQNADATT